MNESVTIKASQENGKLFMCQTLVISKHMVHFEEVKNKIE